MGTTVTIVQCAGDCFCRPVLRCVTHPRPATGWSEQPLEWQRVKELLEALVEEGIVERASPSSEPVTQQSSAAPQVLPHWPQFS